MANFVFAEGLARLTYSAHASHIEWDAADPTNGLLYAALLTTTIPVDDMSVASVDLIAAAADSVMAAGQDTNLAATERKIQGSDTEDAEHFRQYDASDLLFASVGASTDAAVVSLLVYQCTATAGHGSHDTNHSSHVPICHLDFQYLHLHFR